MARIPVFYKVYQESPVATLINVVTRTIATALIAGGIFLVVDGSDGEIGLIAAAIGIVFWVTGSLISKRIARKKAEKLYGKKGEKLLELIPMREEEVIENGMRSQKKVPDIVEGMLNPPATIHLHREKKGIGKIQYLLNDKVIGELRNEEVVTASVCQAVNQVYCRVDHGGFSRKITLIVRPGETVTIHYSGYTFAGLQRDGMTASH